MSQLGKLFLTKSRKTPKVNRVVASFKNQFEIMKKKNWSKIYVAVDIHDTTMKPTYSKELSSEYYPLAKETLQLISKDPEVCLILWTCSTKENCDLYLEKFKNDNIDFKYVNCNPEVVSTDFADYVAKIYGNVFLDDKCMFLPYKDWPYIYNYWIDRSTTK